MEDTDLIVRKPAGSTDAGGSTSGNRSSEQERRVDAKALIADEGRGKLRKAMGSRKQALIHGYPNGGTRPGQCPVTVQ